MKSIMRCTRNCLLGLVLAILVGFLLVSLSNRIPVDGITQNLKESAEVFKREGTYPHETYSEQRLDNYTDCIILGVCAYPGGESTLDRAVNAYYSQISGKNPCDSFVAIYGENAKDGVYRHAYARYWHGYQILLRPLLTVFNYSQIREIYAVVQYTLLAAVLLLTLRRSRELLLPFLLCILLLSPTAIADSLQFGTVYCISLTACILLLGDPKRLYDNGRLPYLFFASGIGTAFFDFLTAPTLTLTIPLCFVCARMVSDSSTGMKPCLKLLLRCVILWFVGYAGMWGGKWCIGALSNGLSFFGTIQNQMEYRLSATNQKEQVSRLSVLGTNLACLFNNGHLTVLTAAYAAVAVLFGIRTKKEERRKAIGRVSLFAVPMAVSLLWIILLSNHSSIHFWFTYRTLAPAVFALLSAVSLVFSPDASAQARSA